MYNIPCCGPELGAFALGEEDDLSPVGIEVVLLVVGVVVVVVVVAFVVFAGGGVFLSLSAPVISTRVKWTLLLLTGLSESVSHLSLYTVHLVCKPDLD